MRNDSGRLRPQVVLLSDGNATHGSLANAALGANVPVSVVPLKAFAGPEVCLSRVVTPPRVAAFEDVSLEVFVDSNHADQGTLEVLRDDVVVKRERVELAEGENRFRLRVAPGPGERTLFLVRLTGARTRLPRTMPAGPWCSPRPLRRFWWPPARRRRRAVGVGPAGRGL